MPQLAIFRILETRTPQNAPKATKPIPPPSPPQVGHNTNCQFPTIYISIHFQLNPLHFSTEYALFPRSSLQLALQFSRREAS